MDEVIIHLGYTVNDDEDQAKKDEILQKLADGEITSDEALKLLK